MRNILCFGDSNTYGLNPEWVHGNFGRHDIKTRWTGRLQELLGSEYRIIEEGLNGRTTVFTSPMVPDRCGLTYFKPCIESHNPLDLIIIMLGTNDANPFFNTRVNDIAGGLTTLIKVAKNPDTYMGMPIPKILVAVPVPLGEAALSLSDGMTTPEMIETTRNLAPAYKRVADMNGCEFIDLGEVAQTAPFEGVHLTPEAHAAIAEAYARKIREIFE